MTELTLASSTSPFDAIKREDENGEYWTARDCLRLLGFKRWSDVDTGIRRAVTAINNLEGPDAARRHVEDHLSMVAIGSGAKRQVNDYKLTRYGAYMWAMNCDPAKPEVAAAQHYFAVKTREAEVTVMAQQAVPGTFAEALELALEQAREIEAKNAQIAELAPKAAWSDLHLETEHMTNIRDFARDVQQWATDRGQVIRQQAVFDWLNSIGLIIRNKGNEHNHATAEAIKKGLALNWTTSFARSDLTEDERKYAVLTPRGVQYAWDRFYTITGERLARELPKPPKK